MIKLADATDPECLAAVTRMQSASSAAYRKVIRTLREGQSEREIAEAVRAELESLGVTEYWYTIPILILVGTDRFLAMTSTDYDEKSPSEAVKLEPGDPVFIDVHPRVAAGTGTEAWWGNFAGTSVFGADRVRDAEQLSFLDEMQAIQFAGIKAMQPGWTAADLANWYVREFDSRGIKLVDVRGTVGHAMQSGAKEWVDGETVWLDPENGQGHGLDGLIVGVEPAGTRDRRSGKGKLVGRFETCVGFDSTRDPFVFVVGNGELLPTLSGAGAVLGGAGSGRALEFGSGT